VTQVISQVDAKKMGLIKTTVTAPTTATDKTGATAGKVTSDKKLAGSGANAKEETKIAPKTGTTTAPSTEKKTIGGSSGAATSKISFDKAPTAGAKKGAAGNDEADPIDDSLKERIKAGGVT